ncbi:hypothetical protein F5J12DRAFT_940267 [Pisolithus orientalis]|uniref:uncharacterized protein n=1 Tax=Pisolithus orientalis TaxID=936130 RepID=UPI0022256083|nr:uncharacterized protein F5J12DRAFT_940267 [Pisolithus orientalis]KAI6006345.1 hypothetical protein F5J12DRAFT_940267 [Pisolithus orientalis]
MHLDAPVAGLLPTPCVLLEGANQPPQMLCVPYAVLHDLAQSTHFNLPAETPSINHHLEVVAALSSLIASNLSEGGGPIRRLILECWNIACVDRICSSVHTNVWTIQTDTVHAGAELVQTVHPAQNQMSLTAFYEFFLAALPRDGAQSQHVACRGRIYSLVPTYTWTIHTDTDRTNAELVYHVHSDHPDHPVQPAHSVHPAENQTCNIPLTHHPRH